MQNLTNFPLNYIAFVYTHIFLSLLKFYCMSADRRKQGAVLLKLTIQQLVSHSWKVKVKVAQPYPILGDYSPWNSPGQDTGVHSLSLLQGILQPRDQTQVSHNASGFFTRWGTRSHDIAEEQCKQNIQNATILREGCNWLVVNFFFFY